MDDDNTLWYGGRNGLTFGRFDKNNPKISGPQLKPGRYYLIAGRMATGTGSVLAELFMGDCKQTIASSLFPVNAKANPSCMAVGQERDAIEHPGKESFDGEIARLLIWKRPLSDDELRTTAANLIERYKLTTDL